MSLNKKVRRNGPAILFFLLIASMARADNKPRTSPPPKPAAAKKSAPAAHKAAKANTGTAPSQHPASSRAVPGAHTGSTGAGHPNAAGAGRPGSSGLSHSRATTRTFSNGTTARFSAGGRIQSIHTANGVTIRRGVAGQRTIVSRSNGRTLVSTGPNSGYAQHAYMHRNGRMYVQRTYVIGGRTNVYVYNRFSYRGAFYYGYVPGSYYRPAFYGWAYNPWLSPVYYRWDWLASAWYAPYGYYFTPAPSYPVASMWLTDYVLAESLRAAYDASVPQPPNGPPPDQSAAQNTVLTPEIKQAIAEEVKREIDAERAAAASQPQPAAPPAVAPAAAPPATAPAATAPETTQVAEQTPEALDPAVSVFVVSANLDVNAGDQACSLSPGDVVTRVDAVPDAKQNVTVKVASSKRSDCPTGQSVAVTVADLQEMHNDFRAKIDSGLKTLADNQGKNGLPQAQDTRTVAGEVPQPAPDAVRADLQKLQAVADQTEADVKRQAASTGTT
jgi:hypothetical protein